MINFVSLGPGNPAMLSMEAIEALKNASMIIVPGKRTLNITNSITSNAKIIEMPVPMSNDRKEAKKIYDSMAEYIADNESATSSIVIAVEGDCSIYASIHYVMDRLIAEGHKVKQIAGIPSFIAAAAMVGISLISGNEKLSVLPGTLDSKNQLSDTTVVMKLSRCSEFVKHLITDDKNNNNYTFHYFENVSNPSAYYTKEPNEILNKDFPYFSLLIIKKNI